VEFDLMESLFKLLLWNSILSDIGKSLEKGVLRFFELLISDSLDTKSKSGLLSGSVKTSSGAKRWSFV
jgi:hypothetical protein